MQKPMRKSLCESVKFPEKKEDEWELSTTDNFKWCSVRSILQVVGAVDDGKWPNMLICLRLSSR